MIIDPYRSLVYLCLQNGQVLAIDRFTFALKSQFTIDTFVFSGVFLGEMTLLIAGKDGLVKIIVFSKSMVPGDI